MRNGYTLAFIALIIGILCASFIVEITLDAIGLDGIFAWALSAVIMMTMMAAIWFLFERMSDKKDEGIRARYNFHAPRTGDTIILILMGVIYVIAVILFHSGVIELFGVMGFVAPEMDASIPTFWHYLLLIICLALLPAIVEELFFRGLIFHGLLRHGRVVAIIASAVMFSLMHLSPLQTASQLILGIVLAMVYLARGNIIYPMILHFINNFVIITYTYIMQGDEPAFTADVWTFVTMFVLLLSGIAVIIGMVRMISKKPAFKLPCEVDMSDQPRKKFWTVENWAYFVGTGLAALIWIVVFVSSGEANG